MTAKAAAIADETEGAGEDNLVALVTGAAQRARAMNAGRVRDLEVVVTPGLSQAHSELGDGVTLGYN